MERLSLRYQKSEVLSRSVVMVRNYAQLAEEKVLYEEPEYFNALDLRIEGIIWSEGQSSLAIIAGEPIARGVQDRVRGTVIQAIDRNQVSSFPYNRRKYTFLRYIGEDFGSYDEHAFLRTSLLPSLAVLALAGGAPVLSAEDGTAPLEVLTSSLLGE